MSEQKIQDNLNALMFRALIQIKHGLIKLAEERGLTVMQAFTVCLMEPGKSVPMNSMCGMLYCDASNITGIVDRLVQQQLIDRKECAEDRRVKTITLTEKGEKTRKDLLRDSSAMQLPGIATLSTEEAATLQNLLRRTLAGSCMPQKQA